MEKEFGKQEVMKTETNLPVESQAPERVSAALSSDLIIPKLLLMQGLSDAVADRKAQQGDIIRSTTMEKLGDDKTSVELIPLTIQNVWMNQEKIGSKFEFRGYEPRTASNETLPWEYNQGGTQWKRTKVLNLFALLPADIEAYRAELKKFEDTGEIPDMDKVLMPVVVPFRNTSFAAGRTVATLFLKAEGLSREVGKEVPVYGKTLLLSCVQDKNDKGSFFIYEVDSKGKKTDASYLSYASTWHKNLQAMGMNVKVDEANESESLDTSGAQATRF